MDGGGGTRGVRLCVCVGGGGGEGQVMGHTHAPSSNQPRGEAFGCFSGRQHVLLLSVPGLTIKC